MAASCGDDEGDVEVTAPTETAAPATDDEPADTTTTVADVVDDTQDGDLLDTVLARGELNCGVSGSAVAFSETQPDGSQTGFDADYCRAVAAALFGDAEAVVFTPLTAAERFTAVQTGEVDVL
ncbi:MAG: transporter substrate-binding domain-containing protein, partial [Acidimicrobiaceae bacterium]|nr:transporter substrate-binding domain-containing protein [Acidimicrobiaceae bacterium]